MGGGADDFEGRRFAAFQHRARHAYREDAVTVLRTILHHSVAHLNFAVRAVPALVVQLVLPGQPVTEDRRWRGPRWAASREAAGATGTATGVGAHVSLGSQFLAASLTVAVPSCR